MCRARVLFTLATSFLLPPMSLSYLTTSIDLYRHSITLTENTLLQLDAAYNLAQALLELGDVIEDLHPEKSDQVKTVRDEAREMLEKVMLGQEEYVLANAEQVEIDQASQIVDDSPIVSPEKDGEMQVDEGETTYETHVPTPTSLIDTALLLVDAHLTLWTTVQPATLTTQEQQNAVRNILDRAGNIVPVGRQPELDLAEIKVLVTMDEMVWEAYKSEAKFGSGIEKSLEGAIAALVSLLASLDVHPPEEPTLRAEILGTLASTHDHITHRLLFLAPQLPPGPSPLAQGAWYNLSQCVTHLGKALDLPINPTFPKTFKPNVLLDLSKASLSRAKLFKVNDTAKNNIDQLIDNSITYATRALDGLGWSQFFKPSFGSSAPPFPTGWAGESLFRSVVLQILRIGFVSTDMPIKDEIRGKVMSTVSNLNTRLTGLTGERKIGPVDITRWVEEVQEDEQGMSEVEQGFWRDQVVALKS